jgi:hypothetical protein
MEYRFINAATISLRQNMLIKLLIYIKSGRDCARFLFPYNWFARSCTASQTTMPLGFDAAQPALIAF